MSGMFSSATAFNQALCWELSDETSVNQMFKISEGSLAATGCTIADATPPTNTYIHTGSDWYLLFAFHIH
jgi:hypothetical protein